MRLIEESSSRLVFRRIPWWGWAVSLACAVFGFAPWFYGSSGHLVFDLCFLALFLAAAVLSLDGVELISVDRKAGVIVSERRGLFAVDRACKHFPIAQLMHLGVEKESSRRAYRVVLHLESHMSSLPLTDTFYFARDSSEQQHIADRISAFVGLTKLDDDDDDDEPDENLSNKKAEEKINVSFILQNLHLLNDEVTQLIKEINAYKEIENIPLEKQQKFFLITRQAEKLQKIFSTTKVNIGSIVSSSPSSSPSGSPISVDRRVFGISDHSQTLSSMASTMASVSTTTSSSTPSVVFHADPTSLIPLAVEEKKKYKTNQRCTCTFTRIRTD